MNTDRYNRLWPQVLIELLSYDGYIMQIQQMGIDKMDNFEKMKMFSPNGDHYNFWIPCYFNEDHFSRSFQLVTNSISVIRKGITGSIENDFRPEMVLAVLPCLINKTIVFILNGTIYHSLAAIQAYCHLLRLYYRLIQRFPALQVKITSDVEKFKASSNNRDKKIFPDLGEFIINLFFSNTKYDEIKQSLFIEFMCRQIFWIEKKQRLDSIQTGVFMQKVFEHSKIANHLLMFNIMAARYFISNERINQLDQNFGFIPDELMSQFKGVILRIKNVSSYEDFFNCVQINDFRSEIEFKKMVYDCKKNALSKGYISY